MDIEAVYCLYAEISQPKYGDKHIHCIARIHWHGVIMFEKNRYVTNFYLNSWHKLMAIGRMQFNELRPLIWFDYMCKHRRYYKHLKIDIKNTYLNDIIEQIDKPHQEIINKN